MYLTLSGYLSDYVFIYTRYLFYKAKVTQLHMNCLALIHTAGGVV